jgi:hypothetical protein
METHAMDSNSQGVWKCLLEYAQTVQVTTEMSMEDVFKTYLPAKIITQMDNAFNAKLDIN